MTINDGIFSSPGGLSSLVDNGYYNYSKEHVDGENAESPELTINGGTFINAYTTIKNDDGGILTINDGKFYGMIYNVGKIVTINGGYFSTNDGYATIQSIKSNDILNIGKTIITAVLLKVRVKNYSLLRVMLNLLFLVVVQSSTSRSNNC